MEKSKLALTIITVFTVFIIFFSCQKHEVNVAGSNLFKNVELVPEDVAKAVAEKFNPNIFFASSPSAAANSTTSAKSIYKTIINGNNKIKNQLTFKDSSGYPAFYIFNYENNGGFLFMSADYNIQPILAFVEHGEFKKDTVPPALIEWANRTFENTEVVRKGLYNNSKLAKATWRDYFQQNNIQSNNAITPNNVPPDGCQGYSHNTTVGPLLPVTWGQGCTYNNLCPSKTCTNVCAGSPNAWTGCVATCMAQVIRYFQPATPFNYIYAAMPVANGDGEVQRLMRDIGSTVGMDYKCSGSGADAVKVPNSLKGYFKFTSANRITYDAGSYTRVKNSLTNRWPVLLEGCRSQTNRFLGWIYSYGDCHEWVCDGYSAGDYLICNSDGTSSGGSTLYFHMNWGWHETNPFNNDYNGYYAFDNWNIPALNRNYQYARSAVTEIHL